jgi:hypothetical protein
MTDSQKLDFILRAIVTAGGPEQGDFSDELYLLTLTAWLLESRPMLSKPKATSYTDAVATCGCKITEQQLKP